MFKQPIKRRISGTKNDVYDCLLENVNKTDKINSVIIERQQTDYLVNTFIRFKNNKVRDVMRTMTANNRLFVSSIVYILYLHTLINIVRIQRSILLMQQLLRGN